MSFTSAVWKPVLGLSLATAFVLVLSPSTALAHERREVGKYTFVVGFNGEPAFQGEPNGAQLTVTEGDRPVEGLESTLNVSVAFGGGQPRQFPLRAAFRQPGRYVADFIPTRSGAYLFTFSGTIESTSINERFESGPGRFDEVKAAEALQFPEAIPPANEAARLARSAISNAANAEGTAESVGRVAVAALVIGILAAVIALATCALVLLTRPQFPGVQPHVRASQDAKREV